MGAWDTILKYGGKAMKGMGKAANATGNSAVMQNLRFLWGLHPESGFLPNGVRMFLCGFCR